MIVVVNQSTSRFSSHDGPLQLLARPSLVMGAINAPICRTRMTAGLSYLHSGIFKMAFIRLPVMSPTALQSWQCPQGSKLKLNSGPKGPNLTGCVKRAWKSIYQLLEGMATCSFPPVRPQQLKAEAFQESAALPVKAVPSSVLTLLGTAT